MKPKFGEIYEERRLDHSGDMVRVMYIGPVPVRPEHAYFLWLDPHYYSHPFSECPASWFIPDRITKETP